VISVRLRPSRDCSPIVPRISALCKGFSQKSEENFSDAIFGASMAIKKEISFDIPSSTVFYFS
ncbi:hypothetical protein, partial [Sharpea azabuensis]|uniref:hypothetical protein n=1 Tax=Sharpea azabuensis TaxID=322505 RepID=UPI0023F4AC34